MTADISRLNIGFALTGSFCCIKDSLTEMKRLADLGANITPIISAAVDTFDTRFYTASALKSEIQKITSNEIIKTIPQAEPLGPKKLIDIMLIAPCTSNTLGKLANGINDTPVTMAAKSLLRNGGSVVLSISTNDGLSSSARNIGTLLNRKNIFFVPFFQDDPLNKPTSLTANCSLIIPTLLEALDGSQIQPVIVAV